ncbi:MAG: YncE family protein [Ferruginibacter sp.]|nr:YncE family protein [Ferruginibacter sp.]
MKKNLFVMLVAASLAFQSCKKDDAPVSPVLPPASGAYVLSEGSFGGNNTKLGFYNLTSSAFSGDYFLQQNPGAAGLGDTGNDMIIYGGKLYIVMNVSSQVTVLNAATGALLKRIDVLNGAVKRQPRYAVGTKGKVYVSAFDGTVNVIDTNLLNITKVIPVGPNPEGIATTGNYLYVANSGGLNATPDSTVSVIDLGTELEVKKIKVGVNPNKIAVNSAGDVYVSAYGIFGSATVTAGISVINSTTNTLKATLPAASFQYTHIRISGDIAYLYNTYGAPGIKLYNTATNTVVRNEFVTDGTVIQATYGVDIDEQNGDVYVSDAKNYFSSGALVCFTSAGVKKFSISIAPGINPNKVLLKR